ncbi:MAG: GAF domain-containing sensor histidine kinase [Bacteroidota bacterium]
MNSSTLSVSEAKRLAALYRTELLDTPYEAEFDAIVLLASQVCGMPISLISLIDAERQWFKAKVGVNAEQTNRNISFCSHAILGNELLEIPDTTQDERFNTNPLVINAPSIRYYAGVPLVSQEGYKLGTLCVLDTKPGQLGPDKVTMLKGLATQVMKLIELRLRNKELEQLTGLLHKISSITAHDVRNPLGSLYLMIKMQTENILSSEKILQLMPLVKDQLESTLGLLDNLVDWGKIQLLDNTQQRSEFSLFQLVETCMEELQLNSHFKNNLFSNAVLPGIIIYGDEHATRFIVRNLLSNAVKFTSEGTITVSYFVKDTKHFICVKDTGIGIRLEHYNNTNVDHLEVREGTHHERGSGIGLSLVKEQLQKLQGGFHIESAIDAGTSVTVYFPRLPNHL